MAASADFEAVEPAREVIDRLQGPTVVEFSSPTCGHCRHAQPLIASMLARHPKVRHIKIEDGSGRPLGRSFKVRLWPTLVFMNGGKEISRLVRPRDAAPIGEALSGIDSGQKRDP